jgi:oleate hydratase
MAVPLVNWLRAKGVEFRLGTEVTNLGFKTAGSAITVNSLQYRASGAESEIPVDEGDLVFVTNGSMTADKKFGSMTEAPAIERGKRSGAWRLWENLAAGRPEFGNPAAFDSHIDESLWESFTVTMHDPTFFQLMQQFSGSEAGKGGLITFKDSNWLLTVSMFHQPFYPGQPKHVVVWWGYGLYHDRVGQYVKKTLAECSGREILEEVLGHLKIRRAQGKDTGNSERDSLRDALHHKSVSGEESRRPARCGAQWIDKPCFPGPVCRAARRRCVYRGILGSISAGRRVFPAETG